MLIKKTQQKGFSIVGKEGEAILDHDRVTIVRKNPQEGQTAEYVISSPGEYEVADIAVIMLEPPPIFIITLDGFTVSYLPSPPEELPKETLTHLEQADVLMIPGAHGALITKIAPSFVIPLNQGEELAQIVGIELGEVKSSLKLGSSSDITEETEIVNLG